MTDDAVLPALVRCAFRRVGFPVLGDSGGTAIFRDSAFLASFFEAFFGADFLTLLGGFECVRTGLNGSIWGGCTSTFGRGVVGVAFGVHLVPVPVIILCTPRDAGVLGCG